MLDAWDCYELCVQSPRHVVGFLRALHGREPTILREDFCGTAAVARRWCAEAAKRDDDARATAIDLDAAALDRASRLVAADPAAAARLALARGDCTAADAPHADAPADVVFVGNFSIGYIHTRPVLVDYLRCSLDRLKRGAGGWGGGVFVCDTYGGPNAFVLGAHQRTHPGRGKEIIRYTWEHAAADPLTGMVENVISFRVDIAGEIVQELPRAFVYHWRLWSIPELRDAMTEAGFAATEVHQTVNLAPGEPAMPVQSPDELRENYILLVVGRA